MSFDLDFYFNRIPDNFADELFDEANVMLRATGLRGRFEPIEIDVPKDWQHSLNWDWCGSRIELTKDTAGMVSKWLYPDHIKRRLSEYRYACHIASSFSAGPVLLAFAAVFAKHCDALIADYQCVPTMMGFLDQLPKPEGESCWPDLGVYDADMVLRIFRIVTAAVPD
jgi:hypothetical protein